MDQLHGRLDILDRRVGENAVPQVEDEAGFIARLLEHGFHAPLDLVPGGKEHDGIQVALNRDARTEKIGRASCRERV